MKGVVLIPIVTIMSTGWLVGCTKAPLSETLIEYRRMGGFAGLDDRLVIKRGGEATLTRESEHFEFTLDGDMMKSLQVLFEEANFFQLRKEYLPSRPGADLFEYVLTYKGHTVRTMDGAVPSSLWPVLEALNQIVENRR